MQHECCIALDFSLVLRIAALHTTESAPKGWLVSLLCYAV